MGLPAILPCPDGHPLQPGGQKGGLRSPNIRGERRPCGTRTGGGRASGSLAAREERVDLLEALCAPPRVDHHRAPRGPPREGCGGVKAGVRARWRLFKGRTVPSGRAGPCPAVPDRSDLCAGRECWKPAGFSTLAGVLGLRRAMPRLRLGRDFSTRSPHGRRDSPHPPARPQPAAKGAGRGAGAAGRHSSLGYSPARGVPAPLSTQLYISLVIRAYALVTRYIGRHRCEIRYEICIVLSSKYLGI